MLRLALDGTPLLGFRSGVGEVVAGIGPELARRPEVELVAYTLTLRGRNDLAGARPAGHALGHACVPRPPRAPGVAAERVPEIERWTGPVDVVHATNYVAPPTKAGEVVSVYDLGFMHYPEFVAARRARLPGAPPARGATGRVDPHHERLRARRGRGHVPGAGGARGARVPGCPTGARR